MSATNVKNGTPVGNEHLCLRCTWAQAMTGYRESDRLVICTSTEPNRVVPFVMLDCTEFNDRLRPSWDQMQKLAIKLPIARVSARTKGFATPIDARPAALAAKGDDDEDGDEKTEVAITR